MGGTAALGPAAERVWVKERLSNILVFYVINYDSVLGEARLAPVYDLVTTTVYLPKDAMALTMNGSTQWPNAKELRRFGETRTGGSPSKIRQIIERVADAIAQTAIELDAYAKDHPAFKDIAARISEEWKSGLAHSLLTS